MNLGRTADTVEIVWSIIALVGVVAASIGIWLTAGDYRAARQFGKWEHVHHAWHNCRREIVRLAIQATNLVPGILTMLRAPTGGGSTTGTQRIFIVSMLIAASAFTSLNTLWDLWARYRRRSKDTNWDGIERRNNG